MHDYNFIKKGYLTNVVQDLIMQYYLLVLTIIKDGKLKTVGELDGVKMDMVGFKMEIIVEYAIWQ